MCFSLVIQFSVVYVKDRRLSEDGPEDTVGGWTRRYHIIWPDPGKPHGAGILRERVRQGSSV